MTATPLQQVAPRGQIVAGLLPPRIVDENSLVNGDIASYLWSLVRADVVRCIPGQQSDGTYGDLTLVNDTANATGTGIRSQYFANAQTTTYRISFQAMGVGAGQKINIECFQAAGLVAGTRQTINLTNGVLTSYSFTWTLPSSASNFYNEARILCNDPGNGTSAQARYYISRITITPVSSPNPIFTNDFECYALGPDTVIGNCWPAVAKTDMNYFYSPYSRWSFFTSSTLMAIDTKGFSSSYLIIMVDGRPFSATNIAGASTPTFQYITLPAGYKRVDIVQGFQLSVTTNATPQNGNVQGVVMARVYFAGLNETQRILPDLADRKVVIIGDSIIVFVTNSFAGIGAFDSLYALYRKYYPGGAYCESWSSRSLWAQCGSPAGAPTAGVTKPYARQIAAIQPTDIIVELGTNDYQAQATGGLWTAANYGTGYNDLITNLVAYCPGAMIWPVSMFTRSLEGANALGNTLDDYRNAGPIAAAAAFPNNTTLMNGKAMNVAGDLGDGLHFTRTGAEKVFRQMFGTSMGFIY